MLHLLKIEELLNYSIKFQFRQVHLLIIYSMAF